MKSNPVYVRRYLTSIICIRRINWYTAHWTINGFSAMCLWPNFCKSYCTLDVSFTRTFLMADLAVVINRLNGVYIRICDPVFVISTVHWLCHLWKNICWLILLVLLIFRMEDANYLAYLSKAYIPWNQIVKYALCPFNVPCLKLVTP